MLPFFFFFYFLNLRGYENKSINLMVFLARVKKVKRETELQPHTSQTDASQNTMTFRYSP